MAFDLPAVSGAAGQSATVNAAHADPLLGERPRAGGQQIAYVDAELGSVVACQQTALATIKHSPTSG